MNPQEVFALQSRRRFLRNCGSGIGMIALANLLNQDARAADDPASSPLAPKKPHFPPTAKNVIFLFMEGAPSQMDLFDPKPALRKWHGQSLPPSLTKDLKLAFIKPTATVLGSPFEFKAHGQCGMELYELLPHTASCADD